MTVVLSRPFDLPTAGVYARPGEPGAILPVVYGDFTTGGVRGPIPAVLIDSTNWIYAAAGHAVASITTVYVDDIEQTVGVTTSLSNNVESQGAIATITFASQPNGQVSWRGTGKKDSDGNLITDPLDQLQDMLTSYSDWVTADFDSASFAKASGRATTQGYAPAWVLNDTTEIATWINEIMFNILGSWRITGNGILAVSVETGLTPSVSDVVAHLVAARDLRDGEDGVTLTGSVSSLVNAATVYYRYSWSINDTSTRLITPESAISLNGHGEVRKSFTLRGLRSESDVRTWCAALFARQDYRTMVEGAQLEFAVPGSMLAHATKGDVLGFSWDAGPSRPGGESYVNELLRVVSIRHAVTDVAQSLVTAVDTGVYISDDVALDATVALDASVPWGGGRSTQVYA